MLKYLLVVCLFMSPFLHAQDEGDEFFEDESYDEPYEEAAPDIPTPGAPSGDSFSPPPDRTRTPNPRFAAPPSGLPSSRGVAPSRPSRSVDDPVEFTLVDPPKYWTPKKRKRRPLVK